MALFRNHKQCLAFNIWCRGLLNTPKQVQTYPKAGASKTATRGRKPGQNKIMDSPKKLEIRREKNEKNMKTTLTQRKCNGKHKVIKKIVFESDSESEESTVTFDEDDQEALLQTDVKSLGAKSVLYGACLLYTSLQTLNKTLPIFYM